MIKQVVEKLWMYVKVLGSAFYRQLMRSFDKSLRA